VTAYKFDLSKQSKEVENADKLMVDGENETLKMLEALSASGMPLGSK
jgi:hypothetical protein